jgi:thermostable 8-oxoguanine DNA glycosylase
MHQQRIAAFDHHEPRTLELPSPNAEVLPGVLWGSFETFFTPAFWATRAWLDAGRGHFEDYRLGNSLLEEVAACLLGGYGIPAEVGLAAFYRLRQEGVLDGGCTASDIELLLKAPLLVNGRTVRYRFARQKARYVSESISRLGVMTDLPVDDRDLRDLLMQLPGVGPKTASWITRNWRRSDSVAIIDIHIFRGCVAACVFPASLSPSSDYWELEGRFLEFARALGCRASFLDNLMWQIMRKIGHLAPAISR